MLSDIDIQQHLDSGDIIIDPYDKKRLQPASYDILLGNEFLLFDNTKASVIDPKVDVSEYTRKVTLKHSGEYIVLHPKEFILGVSWETVGVSEKLSCELMGKSSLARLGLIVHTTAGFIDPGNQLKITLEMVNFNTVPLKLYPKMKIAQVAFSRLDTPTQRPYGSAGLRSKYYGATTVQGSEMARNFTTD
jgi:dCTP deaminase